MAGPTPPISFAWGRRWSFSELWSVGVLLAVSLVLIGVWLPWTSTDSTDVFLEANSITAGIQPIDYHLIVPAVFVAVAVLTTWSIHDWRSDLLLLAASGPIVYIPSNVWQVVASAGEYRSTEPGIYLAIVGGGLLGILGVLSIGLRILAEVGQSRWTSWRPIAERVHAVELMGEGRAGSDRRYSGSVVGRIRANPSRAWTAAVLFTSSVTLVGAIASLYSIDLVFGVLLGETLGIRLVSVELYVVVPALAAIVSVFLTLPFSDWRPDFLLVFTAVPILYYSYRSVSWMGGLPQASDQLGLYFVIAGGCLLAAVGLASILGRLSSRLDEKNARPRGLDER